MKRFIAARLLTLLVLPICSGLVFAAEPATPGQGAAAELKLPSKLAGKTEGVRGAMVNVPWSMTVDQVTPDGTVRGKITYQGVTCGANNADYAGKLSPDGKTLTIPMPFSGTPYCKGFVFQLTRKDGSNHFEGIYEGQTPAGRPMTLKITLDPGQ
jgi:hypothetical protein